MRNRHVDDSGSPRKAVAPEPRDGHHPTRPGPSGPRRRADGLFLRIAGFVGGLVLIAVASHFVGGAVGHWAAQQWDLNAAMRPPSEVLAHDPEVAAVTMNVKTMEARIRLWRAQIEELRARVEEAGPRSSLDSLQRIDDLKARCALAQAKLDRLKSVRS